MISIAATVARTIRVFHSTSIGIPLKTCKASFSGLRNSSCLCEKRDLSLVEMGKYAGLSGHNYVKIRLSLLTGE